jgi:hypothetical protein
MSNPFQFIEISLKIWFLKYSTFMLKRGWSYVMGIFLQNNDKIIYTEWIKLHGVKLPIIAHKMFNNYKWQSSNKWKLIHIE